MRLGRASRCAQAKHWFWSWLGGGGPMGFVGDGAGAGFGRLGAAPRPCRGHGLRRPAHRAGRPVQSSPVQHGAGRAMRIQDRTGQDRTGQYCTESCRTVRSCWRPGREGIFVAVCATVDGPRCGWAHLVSRGHSVRTPAASHRGRPRRRARRRDCAGRRPPSSSFLPCGRGRVEDDGARSEKRKARGEKKSENTPGRERGVPRSWPRVKPCMNCSAFPPCHGRVVAALQAGWRAEPAVSVARPARTGLCGQAVAAPPCAVGRRRGRQLQRAPHAGVPGTGTATGHTATRPSSVRGRCDWAMSTQRPARAAPDWLPIA